MSIQIKFDKKKFVSMAQWRLFNYRINKLSEERAKRIIEKHGFEIENNEKETNGVDS